jgi:putative ABC transport system permease protein
MRHLRRLLIRLRTVLTRRRDEERLNLEIEEHIALQTQENLRAGMPPTEARRQALLKFGAPDVIKETYRDQASLPIIETTLADVKYGLRGLRKSPGFTAVAVITLALGIGANTAVFSVVYGVIFRPLPYPHPQRIVELTESSPRGSDEKDVTYQELQFLQEHGSPFEFVTGYTVQGYNLGVGNKTERVKGQPVAGDYFHVLGIKPVLGRDFLAEDNSGNGAHVAILSYEFWRKIGSDPETIGRTITLDGEPFTVVGVMPPGLEASVDPIMPGDTDVWTPLALVRQTAGSGQNIEVLGRLRQGLSLPQAQEQMRSITAAFRKQFPDELGPTTTLSLQSYQAMLSSDVRTILFILFGAVGFVLLIACANVANLLLGRATARSREFAVRAALGASRTRLIRQLITESIVLSVLSAVLALLLARVGMRSLLALSPSDLPRAHEIHLDVWAFAFTLAVALMAGILFGLVPAFRASSGKIYNKLGEGTARVGSGRTHGRFRSALVVSEVALCLVLLTGAALLIKTFRRVLNTDPGFNPTHVLSLQVYLSGSRYDSTPAVSRYYDEAVRRIKGLPGVQSAAVVADGLPLQRGLNMNAAARSGQVRPVSIGLRSIQADYFATLGVPLILGRAFVPGDNELAPRVAIISETTARVLFPGRNPIGELLQTAGSDWQVVGVSGDVKSYLDQPVQPTVYVPLAQMSFPAMQAFASWFATNIVVRTSADPLALSHSAEQQLQAMDPSVALGQIRTMDQVRSAAVAMRQFNMTLLTVFAGLALLLAAIGIYGVIAYSVAQRTHEIGLRVALGAGRGDVIGLVLGQGMLLAGLGIGIGIAGALALTRLLEAYLYQVNPTDPIAFAATTLLLAGVAMLACGIPARRATRVDPMVALRNE